MTLNAQEDSYVIVLQHGHNSDLQAIHVLGFPPGAKDAMRLKRHHFLRFIAAK